MANKVYDFLLSGLNSVIRLGRRGNTLESITDSHVEFKSNSGDMIRVRTENPIALKDSVNLEFLRENVLLSYGTPVQSLNELRSVPSSQRRDKQIRLVEDEQAFYQFDAESMIIVPDPDNPKKSVLPNDLSLALPGRWIKSRGRTQYHTDLLGNESGDDHPQYQLRNEKDQPAGYLGLDPNGRLNADTDDLDEGGDNLYFTAERAREASVEDQIAEGEKEKAPSQDSVFQELSNKEGTITGGTPNQFLDGSKQFRNIEIEDVVGLENSLIYLNDGLNTLDDNKENNLPPGNPGEYLHSDRTFKQIDYSEIVGTPPGGGAESFIELTDTPNSHQGQAYLRSDGSSLEFRPPVFLRLDVFGLGNQSTVDINSLVNPGISYIGLTNLNPGKPPQIIIPPGHNLGVYVHVMKGSALYRFIQIMYPVDSAISSGMGTFSYQKYFDKVYIRRAVDGFSLVWDDWIELPSFRPNTQFEIPNHARLNIPAIALENSGNQTIDCGDKSIFRKTGGNSVITFENFSNGQTVILSMNSIGSAYTVQFASSGSESFRWQGASQPDPTETANRRDIYTFLKLDNEIFVSFLGDMG